MAKQNAPTFNDPPTQAPQVSPLGNSNLNSFLNLFKGTVTPVQKPRYADTPPVWKQQLLLGIETQNDIRRFTQFRCWIKPPSDNFLQANAFLSMINAKGSIFVRLNSLDELKAIKAALEVWIPEMEAKMEELKPLESQYKLAREASEAIMQNLGDNHDDDYSL